MTNVQEEMKKRIECLLRESFDKSLKENELLKDISIRDIFIEIPREKDHGDFSTNMAMQIAREAKMPPMEIARLMINNINLENTYIEKVEAAGPGFINFYLKIDWLYHVLKVIMTEKENYGKLDIGKGQKVMVEFVSANPTGPLHMGNARGGAMGDCIANTLDAVGYNVTREFYINDAGSQIEKFGESLEARYIKLLLGENSIDFPEDGYHGEDIISHAKNYIEAYGDKLLKVPSSERRKELARFALERNIESIKNDLKNFGIKFDVWFSEQSLYDSGEFDETMEFLKKNDLTYEDDGAVWLKTSQFGADKDEVLIRSNGTPTYFASDIAYHRNKFLKRNFDQVINLLGADHHGHVSRMKAAIKALGIDPDRLNIIIFQLVRLYRNGEIVRMSKRTGKAITLADILEEIGKDAARFFFNMQSSGNHLEFDLDLAIKKSDDNPVYYIQYAHARICSMLRVLEKEGIKVPDVMQTDLSYLKTKDETDLIKKLSEYPEELSIVAKTLEPSRLTRYVKDVASLFHSFYNACRVKGEEENLMKARLILVESTRIVIKSSLDLLSISAPERM